jgi:STE24 endopeptidase
MPFLYYLFIFLILFSFILDISLDFLNVSHRSKPIPDLLKDIYQPERYKIQQNYEAENIRFSLIQKILGTLIILGVIIAGGFGWLHEWLMRFNLNPIVITLVFFAIIGSISSIISLPFSIWDTFVIEEKYGFNKSTPKLFIIDFIKSLLITITIGGGLMVIITWLFYRTGNWFWILALCVMVVFSFIANVLYSKIIVPLFNKQIPLNEGSLLDSIKKFGQQVDFPVNKVFVIDGSKRSTKANAYFSGFGKNRRVVLFDTLIEKLDEKEVLAVLAHEIGHYRKRHIWISMAFGVAQATIFMYLFSQLSTNSEVLMALGFDNATEPIFHLAIIGFAILFSPIESIIGLFTHWYSRSMEYEADSFAANHGMGNDLINGLKKLSGENLSNLTPHPIYVFVKYSHPTLLQRIQRIIALDQK